MMAFATTLGLAGWRGRCQRIQVRALSRAADTVYALSSGMGRAGVAVVRVSGSEARTCIEQLCNGEKIPAPRVASLRKVRHPSSKEVLDEALVLYFPGPRSFTGEDIAELHVHGSNAVVRSVLEALEEVEPQNQGRIRPADRGEFTRRAFENGRMDLTEVEGLADLIASDSTEQRRQALRQMSGELRKAYEHWREELKSCLAYAEAVIDFGEDVDESALKEILPRAEKLREEMKASLSDGRRGEIVRSGIRVAILGPPNAGKSSLLNVLAKRPAAIVSPIAGTTRDVVQVNLDIGGLSVIVNDTAGIREAPADCIEEEGIRRALQAAEDASIAICMIDGSVNSEEFLQWLPNWLRTEEREASVRLIVANKVDLCRDREALRQSLENLQKDENVTARLISCTTGEGVDELLDQLETSLQERVLSTGREEPPLITRQRHRNHLEACVAALENFLEGCEAAGGSLPLDIATEELRLATRELGLITGIIHVEEVLDFVFQEFCIGK